MILLASAAFGFSLNAQQNIVANFFEDDLGLSGSEFGYITAIREVPGFLLIFLTALFYRLSLPTLTAGALVLLAIGYAFFGTATTFWGVAPWVVISSVGYHTFLQTQTALGMSLTTEGRSGHILGRLSAVGYGGALVGMAVMMLAFNDGWLDFQAAFVVCGLAALVAGLAILRFPHFRNGEAIAEVARRQPIVLRWDYRYYYLLSILDGGRQQILFSFGLWVLVHHFALEVPVISALLMAITALGLAVGSWIGRTLDREGERRVLAWTNVGYVVSLLGYALIDNVVVAVACYLIYSLIFPISPMGASTYLRKIATTADVAPSLAMGVSMQHVAAIVVPVATGYVLNFVGYQVPFLVASVFAALTFLATRHLAPEEQKSAARRREDAEGHRLAAVG